MPVSAIRAAKAAGGGTVYIPAGRYVTGPIELVGNLVLDIDAGAVVRFEASEAGHDLENVTIRGRGLLTTDNAAWMRLTREPEAVAAWAVLLLDEVSSATPAPGAPGGREQLFPVEWVIPDRVAYSHETQVRRFRSPIGILTVGLSPQVSVGTFSA
jgi:hypothetical protein